MLQNTEHAPQGLPGEFLLVFTLLIWILFILIYLSNVKNKLNFWCFLSGMFFSMGVFKEYLYFTLNPYLMSKQVPWMTESFSLSVYSVFTAMLYYFAMPAVMVFSFHFCHLDERHPRLFRWAQVLVFVPCAVYENQILSASGAGILYFGCRLQLELRYPEHLYDRQNSAGGAVE